jgi:hypothetical protein
MIYIVILILLIIIFLVAYEINNAPFEDDDKTKTPK